MLRSVLSSVILVLKTAACLAAEEPVVLEFQNGDSYGYIGCQDVLLNEFSPDTVVTDSWLGVDLPSNTHSELHSLMSFDEIFGSGNRKIPLGSKIISARLIVHCNNPGNPPIFHRVLTTWDENSATWNSPFHLGNIWPGIQTDGLEAAIIGNNFTQGMLQTGFQNFDITQIVQEWSNGSQNLGFAWLPGGYNAFTVYTSEHSTISNRPKLSVTFFPPSPKIPDIKIINSSGKDQKTGTAIKFKNATPGNIGHKKNFYITNTGSSPLGNIIIAKSGKASRDFKLSRTTLPVIAPGETRSFSISFRPTKSGKRSATIKIFSNDPDESPFKLGVSGNSKR